VRFHLLIPWILAGALLTSAYANAVFYQRGRTPVGRSHASGASGPDSVSPFHLMPGAVDEHCPTLEFLGLTQDQRTRIRKCSLANLDNVQVLEAADRISELRSKQYRAWIGSILVVREVLTPEQLRALHRLEAN